MSLNCNEINVILQELDLPGSFIQDIIQPGYDTIAFYTYKNGTPKTILVCTAPLSCRIHETVRKITKNDRPLRFMEFLKSRIKGAKILSCGQIRLERILRLQLVHGTDSFNMYIRLWSNAGNILLCTPDNVILDTMYRRPAKNEVSGGVFTLPEERTGPQNRVWPVREFSEIEQEFRQKHPGSAPLSFNRKVDLWYGEHAQTLSREALLVRAEKWYMTRRTRQENALEKLISKREAFKNASAWKHQGDLILTYGTMLSGQSSFLDCTDYETGTPMHIPVDPHKNVQQNAADYYARYKKEISGSSQLEYDITIAEKALSALDKEYDALKRQTNPVRIEQILRKDSKPKQQEKKMHPGLDYTIDGWYILVGRDANENDDLLRHYVKGPDLWMHTRDCPGGFVFIKNRKNKTVPLEILLYAGNLAVYYSKARKNGEADLYYTQVKHLRRAKNAPKGLVLPTQEKNLHIKFDEARLRKLEELKEIII
ncbi:MAG: NFACT family protein [Treponema sp.]|jgi:predicted ribosome quality control (RQC) complex YloA/Tae2 family protein|nr:NFACT family protein [Treponema sp.]